MPTLQISSATHLLIKQYCIFRGKKMEQFVEETFKRDAELNNFSKNMKTLS